MFRTFNNNNKCNLTVFLVAFGLITCFIIYIVQFLFAFNPSWKFIVLPIQTTFFILLSWVFLKVYLTQPGNTPTFWAVAPQWQQRTQQRKYCLICKNFKPQRAHHCSNCGKCILNMDHHCPWINNCVGFYNRKFFMLFLAYLLVNLLFVLPQQGYLLVSELIPIFKNESTSNIHTFMRILCFLLEIGVLLPITTFMWYHLTLVLSNQTTLMELKRQRDQKNNKPVDLFNPYNLGSYQNFIQVFGKKSWEWFLPVTGTLPCDGVKWRKINRTV